MGVKCSDTIRCSSKSFSVNEKTMASRGAVLEQINGQNRRLIVSLKVSNRQVQSKLFDRSSFYKTPTLPTVPRNYEKKIVEIVQKIVLESLIY